ncbi:MAG: divalent-cation tolerance protein CutA [Saprospiraceae bacterium]|nr:divalent-cation tolerance protein CutA [Saprospiraceae bacterium]
MSFIVIYITHSSEAEAKRVSDHLLQQKLVACANIFPINSAYWWQGQIQYEGEWVSIVKTTLENWEKVKFEVEKIHPYDVPCIMKIEVEANNAYEQWIRDEVK